jgi:ABC-2 type transport system ATP-binding protein
LLLDQVDPGRTAVRSFAVREASLDDVFLALTGHCATQPDATDEEPAHV